MTYKKDKYTTIKHIILIIKLSDPIFIHSLNPSMNGLINAIKKGIKKIFNIPDIEDTFVLLRLM